MSPAISTVSRTSLRVAAITRGAWGFGLVGIAAFSIWALGGKWFGRITGEAGLYVAIAIAFLGLAGLLLHPLTPGPGSVRRFYARFVPAFALYSGVWSAAWFALGFGWGEVLGTAAGSLAFVAVVGRFQGGSGRLLSASTFLFLVHWATYYAGGQLAYRLMGPHGAEWLPGVSAAGLGLIGKLTWGLFYGIGFGAGLGNAFFVYRAEPPVL